MEERIFRELSSLLGGERVRAREPMSLHTTFRIGGPADVFAAPRDMEGLRAAVSVCRRENVPFCLLGKGSNLLVSDGGFRGVVISTENVNRWERDGSVLRAEAGISLARLARAACEASLTGLEFAAGIPGTLGGAVVMNAGAYGSEMKEVLSSATVLTEDGETLRLNREELKLGYRTSAVPEKGYLVLEAELELSGGEKERIRAQMDDLASRRREKQPLDYPSAGSMFKRPPGYFAAKLIEDAGLKGFAVGGARISEKHCGFVINQGGATAADVLELCRQVTGIVEERFGVTLEREVRFLG